MRLRAIFKRSVPRFVSFLVLMAFAISAVSFLPSSNAQTLQTELSYDNGVPIGAGSIGFYGVNFSLPSGVSFAKLLAVRYAWYTAGDNLTIHVTGPDLSGELTPSTSTTSTVGMGAGWNSLDVSSRNLTVSGSFGVVIATTGTPRNTLLFDNSTNTNRSFWGPTLSGVTNPNTFGAFMVRVVIEPSVSTPIPTATPALTTTATPTTTAPPTATSTPPTQTPTPTPTPTPSPSITSTPTDGATQTPSALNPTASPALTVTPLPSLSPSITPTNAASTDSIPEYQIALIIIVVIVVIVVGNRKVKTKT